MEKVDKQLIKKLWSIYCGTSKGTWTIKKEQDNIQGRIESYKGCVLRFKHEPNIPLNEMEYNMNFIVSVYKYFPLLIEFIEKQLDNIECESEQLYST